MLRARLYEMELKKREAQAAAEQAAKTDIGWGHQIRSYVLQPYQMVKDLRTGVQTSNTGAVLDGDLDQFMEAALAQKAFGDRAEGGRGRGVDRVTGRSENPRCRARAAGRPAAQTPRQMLPSSRSPARRNFCGSTASPRTRVS